MTADWIDAVWQRGKLDNIHATDPQFARFNYTFIICNFLLNICYWHSKNSKKLQENNLNAWCQLYFHRLC